MAMPLVIEELWAWVSSDAEGEGVLAAPLAQGQLTVPLVGADRARMQSYRPLVQSMADLFGVDVQLVRFSTRTQMDIVHPKVKDAHLPDLDDTDPMPEGLPGRIMDVITETARKQAKKEFDEHPE